MKGQIQTQKYGFTVNFAAFCILRNNCARKFHAQYLHKLGLSSVNAQYMRKNLLKIVLLSPVCNICARYSS